MTSSDSCNAGALLKNCPAVLWCAGYSKVVMSGGIFCQHRTVELSDLY